MLFSSDPRFPAGSAQRTFRMFLAKREALSFPYSAMRETA
jgi:hypothetical protein